MEQRKELSNSAGNIVSLFPECDPVYDVEIRRMVTAYLASGVASPSNVATSTRKRMPMELTRDYGLCGPHSVSRAPVNTDVHDRLGYDVLIGNPYIVRCIHVATAAYFNSLPLTYKIFNNLIFEHIPGGVEEAIEIGLQEKWLAETVESGWPDEMCGIKVRDKEKHVRPTRAGVYRTIEAISWIIDCVHRVDAVTNSYNTKIQTSTFRSAWPNKNNKITGVVSNDAWQKIDGST